MPNQENETETIHLLKPHRHAGREYPVGGELELPKKKAAWLVGLKVASRTPVPTPATAETSLEA